MLACTSAKEDRRLAAGREALARGDHPRAYELASEMLRDKPESGEAMDLMGLALQARGSDQAEKSFRDAVGRLPRSAEIRDHLAAFLFQSGRRDEAVHEWQEAVRLNPKYVRARYNLGSAFQSSGRFEEAADQFREALKQQPDLVQARTNLGVTLVSLSRFPEAEKELQEAARIAPNDPEVAFNLGAAYVSARKTPEGIRELRRALALRPDFVEARERLGTALFYEGKLAEAAREFGEALKVNPDLADAHLGLGLVHNEEGETQEAIREYEAALRSQPKHPAVTTNLALLYGRAAKAPARASNRVAAFEIYRRLILAQNWGAAWGILSQRTRALYLGDPQRFRYAANKAFGDPRIREKLAAPGFFLPYLEPPSPDPSSGLPYDPSRLSAIQESESGEWKVDFLVLGAAPAPDPER